MPVFSSEVAVAAAATRWSWPAVRTAKRPPIARSRRSKGLSGDETLRSWLRRCPGRLSRLKPLLEPTPAEAGPEGGLSRADWPDDERDGVTRAIRAEADAKVLRAAAGFFAMPAARAADKR